MPFPIQEFWNLAVESRLFTPEECKRLGGAFAQIRGASETGNAYTLSEWLISQKVLTRYQAKVLLARRAGPFIYGDYRVQDRIDSGRLQGLFRAIHLPTRQPVCLYFLTGPSLQDPAALARLKQTLAAASAVRNAHVARLYHVVDLDAYKFAVLADLQGRSLDEFLAAGRTFPAADACRMAHQAALGLAELHANGQTHAAVRPSNLWQDPAGNVKLLHVPVSRDPLSPSISALLSAGTIDATVEAAADYLAPELAAPARWPDHPGSDLYALGCTLYHLLTGQPPFAGGDVGGKLRRHAAEQPPLASQVNPQVPQAIAQVVAYLLAKDPGARYQQAAHVAEALAPYLDPAARQPVVEQLSSTTKAYEGWLEKQAPAPSQAVAIPAPAAAIAIPSPPHGGYAPMSAIPVAPGPVMAATAIPAAVAAPPMATAAVVAAPAVAVPMSGIPMAQHVAEPAITISAAPALATPAPSFATAAAAASAPSASRATLAAQRRVKQQSQQRNKVFIASGVALTTLIVGFIVWSGSRRPAEVAQQPTGAPTSTNSSPSTETNPASPATAAPAVAEPAPIKPVEAGPPEEPLSSVDSSPLWDSPTSGAPLDLRYLPATQMYLSLRPAEIWGQADAKLVLTTLGIEEFVRGHLQRLTGVAPENLEHVVIAFTSRGMDQPPSVSVVARTLNNVDKDALKAAWKAEEEWEIEGKTLIRGEGYTYHLPPEGNNKVIVALPLTQSDELTAWSAAAKNPPLLTPKLERMLRFSDTRRQLTLLAAPSFLQGEGRGALTGTLGYLLEPMNNLLMDDAGQSPAAALASVHMSDSLFLEARVSSDGDMSPTDLAKLYQSRAQNAKAAIIKFKNSLEISPYSREILHDYYPGFFQWIADYTRAGINTADKHVVVRTVLPPAAASNLAFGTHLAMLEQHGPAVSVAATVPQTPTGPLTLADRLKQKYTLTFDSDSLERTIDLISKDTGIPMRIEGGDLQLEGITKNQSFGLDEKDKPLFEVLKTIMIKANPAGKLVYVFEKTADGQEGLKIVTRAGAAKRKEAIPPELQ